MAQIRFLPPKFSAPCNTTQLPMLLSWRSRSNCPRFPIHALARRLDSSACFGPHLPHLSAARYRQVCRTKNSDKTSQLELRRSEEKQPQHKQVNGIFWIILLNLGIYSADHLFLIREVKTLYLFHTSPAWYQFVTAAFCHANWNHLSSNLFFLYIFGKLVEEDEGGLGLWISYVLAGAGANLVSWLVLPRSAVSVGASGAVFGLFAITVLVKMRWDQQMILEVLILGQFVIQKVMEVAQASAGLSGTFSRSYAVQNINHIAHLSGAMFGVSLVLFIRRRLHMGPTLVDVS